MNIFINKLFDRLTGVNTVSFYILSFTWGLPVSLAGLLVFTVLVIFGKKPCRYGCCVYISIGRRWGGCNYGWFCLTGKNCLNVLPHELGHGLQNIILGPLTVPLIGLPSSIRYHTRKILAKRGKKLRPYDSIWFESLATALGKEYALKHQI